MYTCRYSITKQYVNKAVSTSLSRSVDQIHHIFIFYLVRQSWVYPLEPSVGHHCVKSCTVLESRHPNVLCSIPPSPTPSVTPCVCLSVCPPSASRQEGGTMFCALQASAWRWLACSGGGVSGARQVHHGRPGVAVGFTPWQVLVPGPSAWSWLWVQRRVFVK